MEIPYIVEPRKDTGLINSKIAIWLFLASEVMLFGGLFSAYIFLRIGADFPWPERALPILPGLINTAILIASSVTVVFAWAELKLRNWGKFQIYMSATILCAVAFMAIKLPGEYASKFAHQAIRANDFSVIEGHTIEKNDDHPDGLGNMLRVAPVVGEDGTAKLTAKVNVTRFYAPYFENNIFPQMKDKGFKATLLLPTKEGVNSYIQIGDKKFDSNTDLTIENLQAFQDHYVEARTENRELNAKLLGLAWKQFRDDRDDGKFPELDGKSDSACAKVVTSDEYHKRLINENKGDYINSAPAFSAEELADGRVTLPLTVVFELTGPADQFFTFVPAKGTFGGGTTLRFGKENSITVFHRDKTEIIGVSNEKALSGIELAVDNIDLRHLVMRKEREDLADKKPMSAYLGKVVEEGGKVKYIPHTEHVIIFDEKALSKDSHSHDADHKGHGHGDITINHIWETHMKWLHFHTAELAVRGKEPTENEKYMVDWKLIVAYHEAEYKMDSKADYDAFKSKQLTWYDGMFGADHYNPKYASAFPHVWVPRDLIKLESNLTPKWNNYYAIYFTITGLHGLHVIGGALVLGYYLFFGKKMFDTNPEWLTNRVEVGGLFWHFVDLVWIFAFPIFYLM